MAAALPQRHASSLAELRRARPPTRPWNGAAAARARRPRRPLDSSVHDRLLALLAVAAAGRIGRDGCSAIYPAMRCWTGGDRALTAIRLAFVPLPRVESDAGAYALFLAEAGLDAGLSPQALLTGLGTLPPS